MLYFRAIGITVQYHMTVNSPGFSRCKCCNHLSLQCCPASIGQRMKGVEPRQQPNHCVATVALPIPVGTAWRDGTAGGAPIRIRRMQQVLLLRDRLIRPEGRSRDNTGRTSLKRQWRRVPSWRTACVLLCNTFTTQALRQPGKGSQSSSHGAPRLQVMSMRALDPRLNAVLSFQIAAD